MGRVVRVGTVGTSNIMRIIQDAFKKTERMECEVVYSRDPERGRAFADEVGVTEFCSDYDAMVSRDDLDVVYIASPNSLHTAQALKAMQHKKHAIIEKPAALSSRDIESLHVASMENDVYFLEAITTIFMPNFEILTRLLPKFGKIHNVEINYGQSSSRYDAYLRGENPNVFNPEMGGGALNDMGIYCIHAAVSLFGEPDKLLYVPELGPNGVDVAGKLTLYYPHFEVKILTSKKDNPGTGLCIDAEKGWYRSEGPMNAFTKCTAQLNGQDISVDVQHDLKMNRMVWEMTAFRDCIFKKDKSFFERMYHQSMISARVLEKAHVSADKGEIVRA